MQINLTLPLPPSVNEYLGYRVVYINGKAIPQPFETKTAKEYKAYVKNMVKRELKKQSWECLDKENYIDIELTYYLNKKSINAKIRMYRNDHLRMYKIIL